MWEGAITPPHTLTITVNMSCSTDKLKKTP